MNKKVLRMMSALLAILMLLPFAACGRKKSDYKEKRSGKKITADTPWYDCSLYGPADHTASRETATLILILHLSGSRS